MKVLIDNGHGSNTPGKCSPDKRLREWQYSREIADMIVYGLRKHGIDAERIVKEEVDVPLYERCRRANEIYKAEKNKAILVSIHCDAKGYGDKWENAYGWSARVSLNASKGSKILAEHLIKSAENAGLHIRVPSPKQAYWSQNLAICRDTKCPAVLTENLFQDNKNDVEYLLSENGKRTIAELHVNGIIKYLESLHN